MCVPAGQRAHVLRVSPTLNVLPSAQPVLLNWALQPPPSPTIHCVAEASDAAAKTTAKKSRACQWAAIASSLANVVDPGRSSLRSVLLLLLLLLGLGNDKGSCLFIQEMVAQQRS